MDRSLSFGSAPRDLNRAVRTRFRFGTVLDLALPRGATRRLIMQKARGHRTGRLPQLAGLWFQVLFHSPQGVLFTFPSRYLCAIGRQRVFSLGGWAPRIQTGFHVSRPTWENGSGWGESSRMGLSPAAATLSRVSRSPRPAPFAAGPATPAGRPAGLGCSAFARHYLRNHCCLLLLRVLRCFTSPGIALRAYAFSAQ